MEKTDNPEVLAVVPLPSVEERRRREVPADEDCGRTRGDELEKSMTTEMLWHRLDRMVIFFDSVFRIPQALQHTYACTFCDADAEFAKLNSHDVPVAFYCSDHAFEARRGREAFRSGT
jgi:hypothetical protein